jgi:SAM-dependent methyltransferase
MSTSYDNQSYWTNLHKNLKGELKAVGHPFLSESMNQLKYESESESVLIGLRKIIDTFRQMDRMNLSVLDVGAGYGYWTGLVYDLLSTHRFGVNASALDLSVEALNVIRERFPQIVPISADLRNIAPNQSKEGYDFVFSCYCLHHLTRANDFLNALQFVGQSVNQGGFLLIMDPILTMPFSKADTLDFQSFRGNGIPRHLYFIDDILAGLGLRRYLLLPAVSFLLNENIEAPDRLSFYLMMAMWKLLCRLDRIDRFAEKTSSILKSMDADLKRRGLAFSSSVCVYQKLDPADSLMNSV